MSHDTIYHERVGVHELCWLTQAPPSNKWERPRTLGLGQPCLTPVPTNEETRLDQSGALQSLRVQTCEDKGRLVVIVSINQSDLNSWPLPGSVRLCEA